MEANDVPEYLNELIPYRCPKCGNLRRFATLRELRQHLQTEHSFQMGFIKPHARAHVFNVSRESTGSSNFARSLSSEGKSSGNSSKYGTDPVNELQRDNHEYDGRKRFRDTSPLLKSFKEETELLEKELQQARQSEMNHKAQSMHDLAESSVNMDFKSSLGSIQRVPESSSSFKSENKVTNPISVFRRNYPQSLHKNLVEKTKNPSSLSRGQFGSSHDFKSTLDALNTEVMKSRMNQWVTTDALYKSQDLLQDMESAAEVKCQEQRKIIETLVQEMKAKDVMLESRTKQQTELSTERQKLMDETESIVKETDDYNRKLMHELNDRGKILEGLNTELTKLKSQTQQEIKTKDHDLQHATQRIGQLEWERERLIQETDRILKQADDDTGMLRNTLHTKEKELKDVNETLNQLRSHQQSMLEKTMTVYRSSEESRDIMKTAIQTKDSQLQHAMKQIENMSSLHKRLLEQSQTLTDQADDNTASMKRLLHAKGEHIQDLVQQLDTLKREKRHLEDSTSSLAEKAQSSTSVVESLRGMVRQKENDLRTTQSELQDLKIFLKSAADKERVARQKLEVFIEDLIQRAEVAESELHTLKSQSTDSSSANCERKADISYDMHQEDSTERRSLPSRVEPFKALNEFTVVDDNGNKQRQTGADDASQNMGNILSNNSVTMTDVHAENQRNTRTISKYEAGIGKDKGVRLQESGGFVAHEDTLPSDSNDSVYDLTVNANLHEEVSFNHAGIGNRIKYNENNQRPAHRLYGRHPSALDNNARKHGDRKRPKRSRHKYPEQTEYKEHAQAQSKMNSGRYFPKAGRDVRYASTDEYGTQSEFDYEPQSQSDSDDYFKRRSKYNSERKGKLQISKGLQVGAFLSAQDIDKGSDGSSEYLIASSDGSYSSAENKSAAQRYTPNQTSKMPDADKRPVTLGKSHKNNSTTKPNERKSKRYRKGNLNREFDTKFPTSHKSMVNIATDKVQLSEGEVVVRDDERQRRSRSLSPRAFNAKLSNQPGEMSRSLSDTSCYEDQPIASDDGDIQAENMERTDGVFKNIMDENGILWEDDMATLPDVSDSELDRVSPSGSEAIATKNTCNTTTTVNSVPRSSSKTSDAKTAHVKVYPKTENSQTDDISVTKVAHLLKDRSKEHKHRPNSGQMISSNFTTQNINKSRLPLKLSSGANEKHRNPTESLSNQVHFRPIKSKPCSKSSTSEKDLTSGGKEVKEIMGTSPKIDILGTSASDSMSRYSSNSYKRASVRPNESGRRSYIRSVEDNGYNKPSHKQLYKDTAEVFEKSTLPERSDKDNGDNDIFNKTYDTQLLKNKSDTSESISEKIERISSKYSPKHKSGLATQENKPELDLEERIKSINDKYKIRRDDILQRNGISPNLIDKQNESRLSGQIRTPHMTHIKQRDSDKLRVGLVATMPGKKEAGKRSTPIDRPSGFINNRQFSDISDQANTYQSEMHEGQLISSPNLVGYPYMQHPAASPYPPTWSHYPPFHLHPEYASFMHHMQQQQQQQQQQDESTAIASNITENKFDKFESKGNHTSDQNKKESQIEINKEVERGHEPHIERANESAALSKLKEQKTNHLSVGTDNNKDFFSETTGPVLSDVNTADIITNGNISGMSHRTVRETDTNAPATLIVKNDAEVDISSVEELMAAGNTTNSDTTQYQNQQTRQKHTGAIDAESDMQFPVESLVEPNYEENVMTPIISESNKDITGTKLTKSKESIPNSNTYLGLFEDTDNDDTNISIANKIGLFAEEIGDESSAEYDSNTQSYLDLPGNFTDTSIEGDTDTESVRRDFYEKTQKIKDLIDGPQNDFSDVYRHKYSRNTTSSASSQASLEILDRIPLAKREQVKQRRAALVDIFSFLDTRTLSRVAQVCREWRIVSRSPKLWRRVELKGEKVSPQFLRQISRRCSQLRVLILEDLHPRNRHTSESVEDFKKNIRCSLEVGYEQILKKAEASLHTIIIINCGTLFSAKCLWIASCCCRMLKHVTYLSDFDPINAEVMWALGSGCRELKTLKCQPIFPCAKADNFSTRCAQLVGKCFRDLQTVSLGGLIVDVTALIFIAKQCQKLCNIEVHQMKFINCDVIDEMCQNGLQRLKSIQFHATPVAPGALTVLQGNCKYLEEVYIQVTETDFIASVGEHDSATQIPEYHEIYDGYQALKNQPSLCNILKLKAERPTQPKVTKQPEEERSFFDRLFR